ncbi:hypothetical protein NIES2100_41280 [Calothrix sp. NIES-2100]|nr:hypothetical protein NIES2100_41280 [Calothrix sp. NIES-2100]
MNLNLLTLVVVIQIFKISLKLDELIAKLVIIQIHKAVLKKANSLDFQNGEWVLGHSPLYIKSAINRKLQG